MDMLLESKIQMNSINDKVCRSRFQRNDKMKLYFSESCLEVALAWERGPQAFSGRSRCDSHLILKMTPVWFLME